MISWSNISNADCLEAEDGRRARAAAGYAEPARMVAKIRSEHEKACGGGICFYVD